MKLHIQANASLDPNYEIGALKAQMSGFASNLNRILHLDKPENFKYQVLQKAIQTFIQELESQGIKITPPSAYEKIV
jgi:hypothetical protein